MDEIISDQTTTTEVTGSTPVVERPATPPPPKPKPKPIDTPKALATQPHGVVSAELQYRLNIYSHTGNVKPSISASVYQNMCRRHGDIMRSVSSTRWMVMDDILREVWQLEKKMRYPSNRTRKSVELSIKELIECQFVITR